MISSNDNKYTAWLHSLNIFIHVEPVIMHFILNINLFLQIHSLHENDI